MLGGEGYCNEGKDNDEDPPGNERKNTGAEEVPEDEVYTGQLQKRRLNTKNTDPERREDAPYDDGGEASGTPPVKKKRVYRRRKPRKKKAGKKEKAEAEDNHKETYNECNEGKDNKNEESVADETKKDVETQVENTGKQENTETQEEEVNVQQKANADTAHTDSEKKEGGASDNRDEDPENPTEKPRVIGDKTKPKNRKTEKRVEADGNKKKLSNAKGDDESRYHLRQRSRYKKRRPTPDFYT